MPMMPIRPRTKMKASAKRMGSKLSMLFFFVAIFRRAAAGRAVGDVGFLVLRDIADFIGDLLALRDQLLAEGLQPAEQFLQAVGVADALLLPELQHLVAEQADALVEPGQLHHRAVAEDGAAF